MPSSRQSHQQNQDVYKRQLQNRASANLPQLITELLVAPEDGQLKLFLIYRALQARRAELELFQHGAYQKSTVIGSLKGHVAVSYTHLDVYKRQTASRDWRFTTTISAFPFGSNPTTG